MPPEFNQNTMVIAELIKRQNAVPFVPFMIVTSSGKTYEVPSPDHLSITRLLREITVERDDGTSALVNPLHVAAIERLQSTSQSG